MSTMKWQGSFRGDLHFLSNFYYSVFMLDGYRYTSVEHYFNSQKTFNQEEREKVRNAKTPSEAKRLGRKVKLRPNWEKVKDEVMFDGVYSKFSQNEELARKLIETPDHRLVEKNNWGDTYWGVDIDTGMGLNKLGEILKQVKYTLINSWFEAERRYSVAKEA